MGYRQRWALVLTLSSSTGKRCPKDGGVTGTGQAWLQAWKSRKRSGIGWLRDGVQNGWRTAHSCELLRASILDGGQSQ